MKRVKTKAQHKLEQESDTPTRCKGSRWGDGWLVLGGLRVEMKTPKHTKPIVRRPRVEKEAGTKCGGVLMN